MEQTSLKNGLGIAAFVFGIIGFLTGFIGIGMIFDIIAIILGIVTLISKKQKKGLGIAGLTIGALGFIIMVFLVDVFSSDAEQIPIAETSGVVSTETSVSEETNTSTEITTFSEQILVDQNNVKIIATGLESDSSGVSIELRIENNMDKAIMVQSRNQSVNGYMIEPIFSCDIQSQKIANTTIDFHSSDLERCGITTISDIELYFTVSDYDTWDSIFESEIVSIKTECGDYVQTYDDSGKELYNKDGLRIIAKDLVVDEEIYGTYIPLYIENNTGKDLMVQSRNTSINGIMVEPTFSEDIVNGKVALARFSFESWNLEENNIEEINNIETTFNMCDLATWDNNYESDPVTISFE